jgi:hypothetical protein
MTANLKQHFIVTPKTQSHKTLKLNIVGNERLSFIGAWNTFHVPDTSFADM